MILLWICYAYPNSRKLFQQLILLAFFFSCFMIRYVLCTFFKPVQFTLTVLKSFSCRENLLHNSSRYVVFSSRILHIFLEAVKCRRGRFFHGCTSTWRVFEVNQYGVIKKPNVHVYIVFTKLGSAIIFRQILFIATDRKWK